jgi:hypothetical protein
MTGWPFLWDWKCNWQQTEWTVVRVNPRKNLTMCVYGLSSLLGKETRIVSALCPIRVRRGLSNMRLCRIHEAHKLKQTDLAKCLQYCRWFQTIRWIMHSSWW